MSVVHSSGSLECYACRQMINKKDEFPELGPPARQNLHFQRNVYLINVTSTHLCN